MTTGKRFAFFILIFVVPLLSFAQDASKLNPSDEALKGAVEANFERYFDIYKLDVFAFFDLSEKYDTDLKRAVFKKSPEYNEKLKELQDKKRDLMGATHYVTISGEISNYDMKRKGITISTGSNYGAITGWAPNSIHQFSPTAIKINRKPIVFLSTRIPDAYTEYISIPLSEAQGLKLENVSRDVKAYFIFKLSGMKTDTFTQVLSNGISFEKHRWKTSVFTTKNEKLLLINSATGEVLYEKSYSK